MTLQNITLLALAVLPGLFLTTYVYQRDKVDAEPVGLLWSLVLLGALSAVPASFAEGVLDLPLSGLVAPDTPLYYILLSFVVVAVSEEGFKFLMLRLRTWNHPAFDYRFDGIVYATMVAVGFATLENILYVFEGGLETGIARALLSVPGHVAWGVIMGYYYGRAKAFEVAGDPRQSRRNLVLSLLVPIVFHGAYDSCAFSDGLLGFVIFGVALAGDIIMVWLVRRESKNDAAFWRPIAQVGFTGYAAVQAGMPMQQVYAQQHYAREPQGLQGQGYQVQGYQGQSVVPQPSAYQQVAPQPPSGYQQVASQPPSGYQARTSYPQQPGGHQHAAGHQQPGTYPQQGYQQPVVAQPYAAPQQPRVAFSWLKYLGLRILGYLGVMLVLFVVGVILSGTADQSIAYEFLIYLIALMIIFAVPYVIILLFAGSMRKRRLARGVA